MFHNHGDGWGLLDAKIITIHQLCRRSRHMSESLGLGDSINHVYLPTVTD